MKRWSAVPILVFTIMIIGPIWMTGCFSSQGPPTPEELSRIGAEQRRRVHEDSIRTAHEAERLAYLAEERRRKQSVERRLVESREAQKREMTEEETRQMALLSTIYFDYDESKIRTDEIPSLDENAEKLRTFRPEDPIVIEGHCDERGTVEYNLALGERRAGAVKDYLGNAGIDLNRIKAISYGEEKPIAITHDESAWAKNRRVELKRTNPEAEAEAEP